MKIHQIGSMNFNCAETCSLNSVKPASAEKMESVNKDFQGEERAIELHYDSSKYNILSIFSGCGGLDLGFELAGLAAVVGEAIAIEAFKNKDTFNMLRHKSLFNIIYTNNIFKGAHESYKLNFPKNIYKHLKAIQAIKTFPKSDIVLAGLPFPVFEKSKKRLIDQRYLLYHHFIRCLVESQPELFVAENVKGLITVSRGKVLNQITEDLEAAGYNVQIKLLDARDYGVPQQRERVFIVGVRKDITFNYEYPHPTHGKGLLPYVTLQTAIGDLKEDPGPYFIGDYSKRYLSRNRKKRWDEQSFTITTLGRRAPLHPDGPKMIKIDKDRWSLIGGEEQNRRLSIREAARIQTFPDWFEFSNGNGVGSISNWELEEIYKQIGGAVPVMLAKAMAQPVANWIYERFN